MRNRNAYQSHGVDFSSGQSLLCDTQKKSRRTPSSRKCVSTVKKKGKKKADALETVFCTPTGKNALSSVARALRLSEASPGKNLQTIADNILTDQGINADIFDASFCSEPDEFDELVKKSNHKANVSVGDCLQEMFDGCDAYAPVFLNKHFLEASTPVTNSEKHFSKIDSSIKVTPIPRTDSSLDFSGSDLASQFPFFNVSILPSLSCETSMNISFKTPTAAVPLFSPVNLPSPKPLSNRNAISTPTGAEQLFSPVNRGSSSKPLGDKNANSTPSAARPSFSEVDPLTPKLPINKSTHTTPTVLLSTPRPDDINKIFEEASQDTCDIPEEIKRTLLAGIFCFVDVKTDRENCSDAVAQELISMGAKVEKSLNKKVTHLIFKDGRPFIYKRAKSLKVTIVSVNWLEACKRERKMVDPALYPPFDLEKYNESPGMKLPSLKTIQRKLRQNMLRRAGISISSRSADSKPRAKTRSAVTIEKDQIVPQAENNKNCIKKLDFSGDKVEHNPDDSVIVISSEDSSLVGSCGKSQERRNSAPGELLLVSKRKRNEEPSQPEKGEVKKYITIDKMFAKQIASQAYDSEDKENIPVKFDSPIKKRRKLFDPSQTIILSDDSVPVSPVPSVPYLSDLTSTSKGTCRTKLTSTKKRVKKMTVAKRPLTEIPQEEDLNVSRGSLSLFVDPKETKSKLRKEDPPTIVCTSFSLEELQKAGYIIGKLGVFDLEERVSSRTTHVVSAGPRRTINLLFAIVRGCWLVDKQWLLESEKADRWLNEEEFEMKTFSPAVVECRLERRAFGSRYCMELFASVNGIYVSKKCNPPRKDLQDLVRLCHGSLVSRPAAAVVVGGDARVGDSAPRVKEKWILDSITNNTLLPIEKYRMDP